MGPQNFSARYAVAMVECGERCPIEAGTIGRLADHECSHGRLPFDHTPASGRWSRRARRSSRCYPSGQRTAEPSAPLDARQRAAFRPVVRRR
jgi:hypothetical protein